MRMYAAASFSSHPNLVSAILRMAEGRRKGSAPSAYSRLKETHPAASNQSPSSACLYVIFSHQVDGRPLQVRRS